MTKQVINIGARPDDRTGDTLRASFTKCNDNFSELYVPEYLIAAPGAVVNGRVLTDSETLTWDFSIPGQAKGIVIGGGTVVPDDAEHIIAPDTQHVVASDDQHVVAADLTTRTLTNTATITWDFTTAGQAKADVVGGAASTDPLTLVHGLSLTGTPELGGSSYASSMSNSIIIGDASRIDPLFSNFQVFGTDFTTWNTDNTYANHGPNAQTTAKTSMIPYNMTCNYHGAGQKFLAGAYVHSYGMGDAFLHSEHLDYWGGNIAGDEGVGYTPYMEVFQGRNHARATVTSVTRSSINTTITQHIVGSKVAQTVTVADSTGASVGDWVVMNHTVDNGVCLMEAVKLTAVGAGTISGKFRYNYASGMTVKPALVLGVDNLLYWGQQRVVVNLTGPVYSAGQVTSSSGGALFGTGTVWSNSMIGGDATNIGAMSLVKDDYSGGIGGAEYYASGDPLRSWYQVSGIGSATSLGVHSYTTAGAADYRPTTGFPSNYEIRAAGRALWLDQTVNQVICEPSTHTWTVGDTIECVICPYPDLHGFWYHMGAYTPGSTCRFYMALDNNGARTIETGLAIGGFYNPTNAGGGDKWSYNAGIAIWSGKTQIQLNGPADYGIHFLDGGLMPDDGGAALPFTNAISWASNAARITANPFLFGLDIAGMIRTRRDQLTNQNYVVIAGGSGTLYKPIDAHFEVQVFSGLSPAMRIRSTHGYTQDMFQCITAGDVLTAKIDKIGNAEATSFRTRPVLLAQLLVNIGTPVEGMMATVTDSSTNVWGATIAGGGANRVLAYYNGTNWTVAGK